VDVETLGEKYPRWNAKLYRSDLPQNVFIGVSLPFEKNRLKNFDLFLADIDSMVDQALSVREVQSLRRSPATRPLPTTTGSRGGTNTRSLTR
jgi:hypothetical protein